MSESDRAETPEERAEARRRRIASRPLLREFATKEEFVEFLRQADMQPPTEDDVPFTFTKSAPRMKRSKP